LGWRALFFEPCTNRFFFADFGNIDFSKLGGGLPGGDEEDDDDDDEDDDDMPALEGEDDAEKPAAK